MYRNAENAYGVLDFYAKGFVTEEVFTNSIILKDRVPFTP
jgi:hypothetical protein